MVKNKITLNVLADITKKISNISRESSFNESKNYQREGLSKIDDKVLVVFTGSNIKIEEKINCLLELKNRGASLSLVFSEMGEAILSKNHIKEKLRPDKIYLEEDILELKTISKEFDYIVSPNITIDTMSKVNNSLLDGFIPNLIWTFLYMGKEVYVDFQSTLNYLGMDCKNSNIEKKILKSIDELKELGATEVNSNNYIATIYRENKIYKENKSYKENNLKPINTTVKIENREKITGSRKIYTENDIKNTLSEGDTLILLGGSILTPLAKDKIRSMGINIKFE
nr:hypothetical protein [Tissierella sp.]